MSDNKKKAGPRDRARVNVHESYEKAYWMKKFGCSAIALHAAVKAVGVMVADVQAYLEAKRSKKKKRTRAKKKTR